MKRSATFSEDRRKRFSLVRDWRDEIGAPDRTILWVMLNPSIAGEEADDPTIRKTIGFARRWGYGRNIVVNLNPWISTDPWGLPLWEGRAHCENFSHVERWANETDIIVAAWGTQPKDILRTIAFPELIYQFRLVTEERLVYCIGLTASGAPKHPSRAPYTNRPELFAGPTP